SAILAATTNPPANLGIFQGANFIGIAPNFKNPESFQFGFGVEHQMTSKFTFGIDYSQVNTIHLQRNRDINLPAPTGVDPVTGRVLVNRNLRPIRSIGTLQMRDSSARSLYRALTIRANYKQKWMRVNMYYMLSRSLRYGHNELESSGLARLNP